VPSSEDYPGARQVWATARAHDVIGRNVGLFKNTVMEIVTCETTARGLPRSTSAGPAATDADRSISELGRLVPDRIHAVRLMEGADPSVNCDLEREPNAQPGK
jgi:hypothetical protein